MNSAPGCIKLAHQARQQPGRGGILAAQTIGGPGGDRVVAVPVDDRFMDPEQSQREQVISNEPDPVPEGRARLLTDTRCQMPDTGHQLRPLWVGRGY
jgi:hypothetical protein